ncbi:50S ribosomal protein L4, partial [Staphylococcus saprophyticus]|uniref:50S ribosomal protein L4 n=1 Tax=Staphylococcus saprophyticus TaxID=29385 RepID=UPI0037047382
MPPPQCRAARIVFAPTPTSYSYKIPNKMPPLALRSPLSFKLQHKPLTLLHPLNLHPPKTKHFKTLLSNLQQPK